MDYLFAFVWNDGDTEAEALNLIDEFSVTEGNDVSVVGSYDHYQITATTGSMVATELGPRFDNYSVDLVNYTLPNDRSIATGLYISADGECGGIVNTPAYMFDSQLGEIVSLES